MPKVPIAPARKAPTPAQPTGQTHKTTRAPSRVSRVTLPSGRVIDLLAPHPSMWTEEDIADAVVGEFVSDYAREHRLLRGLTAGLSIDCTFAEVCLRRVTKLGIAAGQPPERAVALRELLYPAAQCLICSERGSREFSPPRQPFPVMRRSEGERLRAAIDSEYGVPPETDAEQSLRELSGQLSSAAWRHYVDGQSVARVRRVKSVAVAPPPPHAFPNPPGPPPWEPLPPEVARAQYLAALRLHIETPDGPA